MNQINAGLKKECIFFWRTYRFIGMILLFFGSALLYPLMSATMIFMGNTLETEMQGMEMYGMPGIEGIDALIGMFTPEFTYISSLTMISSAVVLMMILLVETAGAEQKKRSIIIPQTAGLTVAGYVLPKFMLYPPMAFAFTVASALLANSACHMVFGESNSFMVVMMSGILYGISGMFLICLYLFLGISLARPGLSVLYVLAADTVFGLIITGALRIDRFTPWNLTGMADRLVHTMKPQPLFSSYMPPPTDEQSVAITAAITLILCTGFLFATLFSLTAKRMDNTADEIY
jgi:hypothetical protein